MSATTVKARGARVLLVDDNAAFAENLAEILTDEGYAARTAGTGMAARQAARAGFDVAVVDLRLPDVDGNALAVELKTLAPEAEVVLLTGFATLETAAAAVRAGAFAYLVKPIATPDLVLTIEQALRQVRLHHEKRELSRRAQVAEKLAAIGTLTAGLSHEIRNPLNAAGLQLTVLDRRIRKLAPEASAALLEPLGLVRDEIRRLDHLLEDFLQFARPREMSARPVALGPLVDRVLDLLAGEAEGRGVALEREVSDAPQVMGDDERLRQVLVNLVLNALDAAPRGGYVRVSAVVEGDEAIIAVEDNGPGVPAELRDRIFEPFFTTKATGSGLGLPIVHAIVTQHGGTLAVEAALSGGARFALRLPKA